MLQRGTLSNFSRQNLGWQVYLVTVEIEIKNACEKIVVISVSYEEDSKKVIKLQLSWR